MACISLFWKFNLTTLHTNFDPLCCYRNFRRVFLSEPTWVFKDSAISWAPVTSSIAPLNQLLWRRNLTGNTDIFSHTAASSNYTTISKRADSYFDHSSLPGCRPIGTLCVWPQLYRTDIEITYFLFFLGFYFVHCHPWVCYDTPTFSIIYVYILHICFNFRIFSLSLYLRYYLKVIFSFKYPSITTHLQCSFWIRYASVNNKN